MSGLADELEKHNDEIVQRWLEAWKTSRREHDVGEAALKDQLPQQLAYIAEQLRNLDEAEDPTTLWKDPSRLDPEERIAQHIGIEEVVQEYGIAVRVVRDWLQERAIDVSFREYSYFYEALFQLAAESVRRYQKRTAELIAEQRGEYLAGVMHQLRTPLSTLSMTTELLDQSAPAASLAPVVARLRRNVDRIRSLVESVLRLERFRPTDLAVHAEDVHPAELVDEILSDYAGEADKKGLRLEAHVDRALEMCVDPDLFVDAVGNLVQNAVKFTDAGQVIVDAEERDGRVLFRVRDTGPGIPPEKRDSMFQEMQPGQAGGAGIGLRIAQHAAQAMGGKIDMESEVGRGTTLCVWLPRTVRPREAPAEAAPPI